MTLLNVPVGEAKPGETAPRRNYQVKDAPLTKPRGFNSTTIYDFFNECVSKHGVNKNFQGWRDLIKVHKETKKVETVINGETQIVEKNWLRYEKSEYRYLTFGQLQSIINYYGKGLIKIGINHSNTDKLQIYASTSPKWMRTFLACQTQGIPVVTAYDSLGEEGLIHSMIQTDTIAIYTDNDLLKSLINPLKKARKIKIIIYASDISNNEDDIATVTEIKKLRPDIQFFSYEEVVQLGKVNDETIDFHPPAAKDLACIMYTSGSTGPPKGVVLSHENLIAGIAGVSSNLPNTEIGKDDTVIAYLPLAHIFELTFELTFFYWGASVGYANVKTLNDASCKNCLGDIKTLKPTVMVGVAAVWEALKKNILTQIEQLPTSSQKIFWAAYNLKVNTKNYNIPIFPSLIEKTIFSKIKAETGGNLRIILNGGSQISGETQRFISNTIAPMLIGYGLTETCANGTITMPNHFEYDVAGALVGSVTVKLIDAPDAGYYAKNNQGEILIKGLPVLNEYYKNTEETSKAFEYEKGWFSTGDIGEWAPSGALKIIDRKKNLVKTLNGEYIALEKIESVYRTLIRKWR